MMLTTLRPVEETRARLGNLFATIAAELAESERIFVDALGSRFPFVQGIVDHAVKLRGKRLRPALLLLSGQAVGALNADHCVLAAVIEMIHTATLIHDDVLDDSMIRRHAPTVNAEWGNETAVLLGDYLFTHAFHLAASLESTLACRWIGRATNFLCEGEMLQVHNRGNLSLDEESYLTIIRGKTAELTAVACRLGAHYAEGSPDVVDALDTFGREVGVAFQIADDVLDLLGEQQSSGKTMGTDLQKQKLTLPLIRLMECSTPEVAVRIRELLLGNGAELRESVRALLEQSDALEYSWRRAGESIELALAALDVLPPSSARELMSQTARLVVRRGF